MKIKSIIFYLALSAFITWCLITYAALSAIISWFTAINIVLFLLIGKDKLAAKKEHPRTPESTLLGLALAGGFPGLFAGRRIFKHKPSKASFVITMWILFLSQLAVAAWLWGDFFETSTTDTIQKEQTNE